MIATGLFANVGAAELNATNEFPCCVEVNRFASAVGVAVAVGLGVAVGVAVTAGVAVKVGVAVAGGVVAVDVGVGVG